MRGLGAYVMRSRYHAAAVAALSGAMSWLLPPLSWLSAGVVGLTSLKHGAREAALVIGLGGAALLLMSVLALGTPIAGVGLVALWLPVALCALLLRASRDQAWVLIGAGAFGFMTATMLRISVDDPTAWWREQLTNVMQVASNGRDISVELQQLAEIAVYLNGVIGLAIMLSVMITVFFARWWQALMDNPGGFRSEFHRLALPKWWLLPTAACAAAVTVSGLQTAAGGYWLDGAIICLGMFVVHGIAISHCVVAQRGISAGWLFGMYVLLFLQPQIAAPVLATTAITDSFIDIRRLAVNRQTQ
jgi:hypothetical protein